MNKKDSSDLFGEFFTGLGGQEAAELLLIEDLIEISDDWQEVSAEAGVIYFTDVMDQLKELRSCSDQPGELIHDHAKYYLRTSDEILFYLFANEHPELLCQIKNADTTKVIGIRGKEVGRLLSKVIEQDGQIIPRLISELRDSIRNIKDC